MIDPTAIEAEQALLGAVLSDPSGQAHALDHVNPGDFVRPYHRQVFDAMQRIRARGEAPGPHEVRAELRADPDMPEHVHDQPWLITDLMHEAPRSSHAVAYAGLVAENGIRQGLDISGMRMVQAAELDNDSALEVALRLSADARRELDMAQARWAALPAEVRKETAGRPRERQEHAAIARQARAVRDEIGRLRENLWAETSAGLEERLASIAQHLAEVAAEHADQKERQALRQASREARPSGPESEAAGARALADLAAGPGALTEVRRWLRPEHFALPEQGEVYAAMRDMQAAASQLTGSQSPARHDAAALTPASMNSGSARRHR